MPFQHTSVLVAVDDSESADRALDFALELAETLRLPVRIVHATRPRHGRSGEVRTIDYEEVQKAAAGIPEYELASAVLERALERAGQRAVSVEPVLLSGDPAEALLRYAAECDRPMLVVGRRGRGRLQGLLMGSVSDKTVRLARCPVIVIQ
ncbi:MAG: universal stress protein [Wenzhouxiangella sp.]|jgi:nucleotide-binding universal stress UspA family protein|nr:universal stress protein [Wenzhouxiangella sp.]